MPVAFIQSSFKFNMLLSTKSQLARLYSTQQHIRKNHYDVLNITPHATQNEIKSAYYKLTLQYHPDKNKSEYAKQKFQDISDAYEVLSNHYQRKIYDRNTMIRRQPVSTTQEPISDYKDKVYSGSSKIYNFDAWTHAHYGKQMYAARLRRQTYENIKIIEEIIIHSRKSPPYIEFIMFVLTVALIAIMSFREKFDVPVSERRKTESKDK